MTKHVFVIYLALFLLWLGVSAGCYYIAAPAAFDLVGTTLADSSAAGSIAGEVFRRQLFLSCVVVPILFLMTWRELKTLRNWKTKTAILILGFIGMLLLVEVLYLTPEIHRLREVLGIRYGNVSNALATDPDRQQFGFLHGMSMLRALLEQLTGLTGALLMVTNRIK